MSEQAPESGERAPSSLERELGRLQTILGEKPDDFLAGEWREEGEYFEVGFEDRELNAEDLYEYMDKLLEGGIENYWEFCRYKQCDKLLQSLIMWNAYKEANTKEERQKYMQEFQFANESATYFTYLPRAVEIVRDTVEKYNTLTQKWASSYNLGRIPLQFDETERLSSQYLDTLNDAIEKRLHLARFNNAMVGIQLKTMLQKIRADLKRLRNQEKPSKSEILYLEHLEQIAKSLHVEEKTMQELERERDEELAQYGPSNSEEENALLRGSNDEQALEKKNNLDMRIFRILSGKKEETGLEDDCVPQRMYMELWRECNKRMRNVQSLFEKQHARNEGRNIGEMVEHVEDLRLQHIREGITFTGDTGELEMTLDEIARIQHQFGVRMNTEDVAGKEPRLSKREAEKLRGYLDARSEHRMRQIRNGMEAAEKMLDVKLTEKIEDKWNEKGQIFVTDLSEKLARSATFFIPSKKNKNISSHAYRTMAKLLDLPINREDQIKELAGDIQEQMGWPQGKKWKELKPQEREKVKQKCKSILNAKEAFNRNTIQNLSQTMNLIEELPHASELAGETVDQKYVERAEEIIRNGEVPELPNERIDRRITGITIGGKKMDTATEYTLLFRQRQREWGDPEEREGFMGEYAEYMYSLEENVQFNFDMAGAYFRAQQAWQDYAGDILKVTGGTAGSMMLIAALAGGGATVVWKAGKFTIRRMRGGGRLLDRMRLPLGGGAILRIGGAVAVAGITLNENLTIDEKMEETTNPALRAEYEQMKLWNWVEAGGIGASLRLNLPAALVMGGIVIQIGKKNRERREVKMDWDRTAKDWEREYGSADLRQALADLNEECAVEAGGGGLILPRGTQLVMKGGLAGGGTKHQHEAVQNIKKANRNARCNVYRAYFRQNTLAANEGKENIESAQGTAAMRKLQYINLITRGDYRDISNDNLTKADAYAQLLAMREGLEQAGKPVILPYTGTRNKQCWLDLRKLTPPILANRDVVMGIVTDYVTHVQSLQELIVFYQEGKNVEDSLKKWDKLAQQAHVHLFGRLAHYLHDAEATIRSHDWSGFEWTGGEEKSQNIVRAYVAQKLKKHIDPLIARMLNGKITVVQYEQELHTIENELETLKNIDDVNAYLEKAKQNVDANAIKEPEQNPLYTLFLSEE